MPGEHESPQEDRVKKKCRRPLTVEDVQVMCRKAKAPILEEKAAAEIARMLNQAFVMQGHWNRNSECKQLKNLSAERMSKVAEALGVLRDELPNILADSRTINPDSDSSLTEKLLEMVNCHQSIIENYSPQKRGRPQDLSLNVQINIGNKYRELAVNRRPPSKKVVAQFVIQAMAWLGARPHTEEAILKSQNRRTKKS